MSLETFVIFCYLGVTLYIGLSRNGKIKNISDYALGGRNFSTAALVATITATYVSGGAFATTLSRVYSDGISYLISSSGVAFSLLITAFLFVPKMQRFLGKTSLAEAMGDSYGKEVRVIVAVCGTVGGSIGSIAVQYTAFGSVLAHFSGISNSVAIIIVGVVVTVYSAMGGVRAVTFTDVFQSFTFCLGLPMVGLMIWSHLYSGSFDLSLALSEPKFSILHALDFHQPSFWEVIPLFFCFSIPAMYPADFQRVSMGSSISQTKKAWAISACIVLAIKMVISWIPFLVFSVNPNLEKQQVLGFVLDNYAYGWMRIVLILGIMAMAMSTADSKMNSSAVLFSNDLCRPFGMNEKYELRAATWFSFMVGAFSILLAIAVKDLLDMMLFANAFYVPIVFPSLCLMIFGVRIAKAPVLIGMAAGLTFVVIWKYLAISTDPIVFATLVNLVFMLTSHYLLGIGKNLSSLDNGDLLESKKT